MNVNTRKITHERFGRWEKTLANQQATPALIIAIGHNEKTGQVNVVCVEELTDQQIIALLEFAIQSIKGNTAEYC